MSKDKLTQDVVYALADYKQLVLSYKSRYAELIKRVAFWKTSALWLALLTAGIGAVVVYNSSEIRNSLLENQKNIVRLNSKVETISAKLDTTQQELIAAKEELNKKDIMIRQLEQNISNSSRELIEKLLKE